MTCLVPSWDAAAVNDMTQCVPIQVLSTLFHLGNYVLWERHTSILDGPCQPTASWVGEEAC